MFRVIVGQAHLGAAGQSRGLSAPQVADCETMLIGADDVPRFHDRYHAGHDFCRQSQLRDGGRVPVEGAWAGGVAVRAQLTFCNVRMRPTSAMRESLLRAA
jgi:hypothetical protein